MQELLYTSVPRGLKPGSRGFCTVLSTQGMVAPLAAALEGLSGYRPVFPIGHERVAENPVVYSHLKLQVAGKSWYVLSRIADYGLDYSQRTNKLAHHLVLDKSELPAAGPASLLRASGIMRESWEGDPKIVPPKPISRQPTAPSGVCQAWKEMTGDAGWAGVLAESFLKDPNRPVILLFEPGQDLRPLIDESLSLLPPERRWDVTFSTYFTGSSQGITCLWRGIVVGSKEATESLRFVNALRIDLTSADLGRAEGGELIEAARKGVRASARPTHPSKQTAPREQQPRVVVMDDAEEPAVYRSHFEESAPEPRAVPIGSHDHALAPPRLTPSVFKIANARNQPDSDGPPRRTSGWRKPVLILGIFFLLSSVILSGWFLISKLPTAGHKNLANALTADASNDSSAGSDPKVGGATPSAKPAQIVTNDSASESPAVAANNSSPSESPKPEEAPPKDKAATYKVELDPPQAEFKVEGDGVTVTGDGKQRTVTVAKPGSTKTVVLIAKLQGYQEGRHQLHPTPGVTEDITLTLKPEPPPKPASSETKLTRISLPGTQKTEPTLFKLQTPAAKSATITCFKPKFEKPEGFDFKPVDGRLVLSHNQAGTPKSVAHMLIQDDQLTFEWITGVDAPDDALKTKTLKKATFCYLEVRDGASVSHRISFFPEPSAIHKEPPKGPSFKLISDLKSDLGRALLLAEELKVEVVAKNVVLEFNADQWQFSHSKEKSQANILECQQLADEFGQERVRLEIKVKDAILNLSSSPDNHPYSKRKDSLVREFNSKVEDICKRDSVKFEKTFSFSNLNTEEKQKETSTTIYQWYFNSNNNKGGGKGATELFDALKEKISPIFNAASDLQGKINSATKQAGPIKTKSQLSSCSLMYRVDSGGSEPRDIEILHYDSSVSSLTDVTK